MRDFPIVDGCFDDVTVTNSLALSLEDAIGTSLPLRSNGDEADSVIINIISGAIRLRYDGKAATSNSGTKYLTGEKVIYTKSIDLMKKISFIGDAGAAVVSLQFHETEGN